MDAAAVSCNDHFVLLAYVDESGNTGDPVKGGSLTYCLGCILIDADEWPSAFDNLLDFRRRLRSRFKLPMRAELKANYLIRNSGDIREIGLTPGERHLIYRAHMRILRSLPSRAFTIVLSKGRHPSAAPGEIFNMTWEALLQRLARTSSTEHATFAVVHDEGENHAVRRWVRRARRYLTAGSAFGSGTLHNPAPLIVDDPVPRQSHQSYFIQLADLVAYAGFRAVVPPGPSVSNVCPAEMWDEIGPATHTAVNRLKPRAKPGVVLR